MGLVEVGITLAWFLTVPYEMLRHDNLEIVYIFRVSKCGRSNRLHAYSNTTSQGEQGTIQG